MEIGLLSRVAITTFLIIYLYDTVLGQGQQKQARKELKKQRVLELNGIVDNVFETYSENMHREVDRTIARLKNNMMKDLKGAVEGICANWTTAKIGVVDDKVLWRQPAWDQQDILGSDWDTVRWSWGKGSTIEVTSNPVGSGQVLRAFYPQDSYIGNPDKSKRGGGSFRSKPIGPGTSRTLSYDIYFAPNFDFVRGGKLPGLWGGYGKCNGGVVDHRCFSTRFMWRGGGSGDVYLYSPTSQKPDICSRPNIHCNPPYGIGLGRGAFRFQTGRWYKLQQFIELNTPGRFDGIAKIFLDGKKVFQINDLSFRNNSNVLIDTLWFDTAFGGQYIARSTRDTYAYFNNFELWDHSPIG
ncbi:unnamed protein product [Owenia fusiformis]|uniref:Polysaccharide lyase 14 domain-containing protein n=1 Tax=Owenia fusiformis TaxID=6347 RepID=A0A8S4Q2J8_OWEFU|nr:unnamed protein product [Owenia fusiformis]